MYNEVLIKNKHYNLERERRHKLSPVAKASFKAISLNFDTVVVEIAYAHERISRDRVVLAPPPSLEVILAPGNPVYTESATPEFLGYTWPAKLSHPPGDS